MKLLAPLLILCLVTLGTAKKIKYVGPGHVDVQDSVSLRDIKQTSLKIPEKFLFDINWGWVNGGQATLELNRDRGNLWKIQSRS